VIEAEHAGQPFLLYRDGEGREQRLSLEPGLAQVSVGRGRSVDLMLDWDEQVSRLHARFERVGEGWTIVDDGLSSNGTFVNGARVGDRRRLADGDTLRFGTTTMTFRAPAEGPAGTVVGGALEAEIQPPIDLSTSQRRVLVALCRPSMDGTIATPATDQQIADELFMSVDVVKKHLSVLFAKLDLERVPQQHRRAQLVERAFQTGLVSQHDL
jgi:DNA-binding CsgD family transcriptional regulator